MTLTYGALFDGIGGLSLGLDWAGMTKRWCSEIDPYCCRVLKKHWPDVPNLGDVKLIDWKAVEPVDLIAGGYPCQPFSLAGVRRGETDSRHLWPWFRDAIRVLRPRFALLENVPGHLGLGFGTVHADLAALGYDTQWDCITAASQGAPHLRDRVFVVAHSSGGRTAAGKQPRPLRRLEQVRDDVPDAERDELRHQSVAVTRRGCASVVGDDGADRHVADAGSAGPQRNRPCGAARNGDWWAVEPDVGRVAHGVPHRVDRLRALGNAVVPQVAEWIGRRILEAAA